MSSVISVIKKTYIASCVVVFMPNVPFKQQLQLGFYLLSRTLNTVFQFLVNIQNRMVFMLVLKIVRCKNVDGHLRNPDACRHSWLSLQVKEL